jgi:hypothetical protein
MRLLKGAKRRTITRPGAYADLPEDVYHGDPVPETSLSNSGAKKILDSPARFRHDQLNPPTATRAFNVGRAAHAKALGVGAPTVAVPDELLSPDGGIRSNAAKAWVAEHEAAGATVLKRDVVEQIDRMAAALLAHEIAGPLLRQGIPELSLFARDPETRIMLRARLDWLTRLRSGRPVIVDYKTAESANPRRFGRAAHDFGYHMQDDTYREVANLLVDQPDEHAFLFVVQEKTAPFLVSVCEMDDDARAVAAQANRAARRLYVECMTSGVWPGYAPVVHPISLPAYAGNDLPTFDDQESAA